MKKINLHLLCPPHGIITKKDGMMPDAFVQTLINFKKAMFKFEDYNIIQYGHEESELDNCHEHVTVTTNEDFKKAGYFDYDWQKESYKFNYKDAAYQAFFENATNELEKHIKFGEHDIILTFGGFHSPLMENMQKLRALVVDPSIGHRHPFADYRVFITYTHMHAMYGYFGARKELYDQIHEHYKKSLSEKIKMIDLEKNELIDWNDFAFNVFDGIHAAAYRRSNQKSLDVPRWADGVIYLPIDFDDFDYVPKEEKEDYYLFLGRLNYSKGFEVAINVAKEMDKKLVLVGHNNPEWALGYKLPSHVEYLGGSVGVEERRKLMSKAKIGFAPTLLNEPGGFIIGEYGGSGTPVLTTDWGGFVEYVDHGRTGYRCRTFEQFVSAAETIDTIDSENCYNHAIELHGLNNIASQYDSYFKNLIRMTSQGYTQVDVHTDRIPDSFWNRN